MVSSRVVVRRADGRTSAFETPLVGEAGALACAGAIAAVEAAFDVTLDDAQLTAAFAQVQLGEQGSEAVAGHDAIGVVAAESGARLVVAIGGGSAHRMADEAKAGIAHVFFAPSVEDGLAMVLDAIAVDDLVLVKASRSVGLDRIVGELERQHGPRRLSGQSTPALG